MYSERMCVQIYLLYESCYTIWLVLTIVTTLNTDLVVRNQWLASISALVKMQLGHYCVYSLSDNLHSTKQNSCGWKDSKLV